MFTSLQFNTTSEHVSRDLRANTAIHPTRITIATSPNSTRFRVRDRVAYTRPRSRLVAE